MAAPNPTPTADAYAALCRAVARIAVEEDLAELAEQVATERRADMAEAQSEGVSYPKLADALGRARSWVQTEIAKAKDDQGGTR